MRDERDLRRQVREDVWPYELWKAEMEWQNEHRARLGKLPWITKRQAKTVDPSRVFLAMAPDNDPFWAGRPAERPLAEWFAELHARRVGDVRRHIWGVFYIASGVDPDPSGAYLVDSWPAKYFDGAKVDKTNAEHWDLFQTASKWARNSRLVHPELIIDTKTQVAEYFRRPAPLEPWVDYAGPNLTLPDGVSSTTLFTPAEARARGYRTPDMVPSLIELWIEKELDSPDQPIIDTVCRRLGGNIVTGTGNMRISQAHTALRRQREAGGIPLRILFLSDFDDAGDHMAVSPARHIQAATFGLDPRPDVRLFHLGLTAEQVIEQDIPPTPPKTADEEKRARERYFDQKTGNLGSVQLNALTDTGSGRAEWFERLLTDAIQALRDPDLTQKWMDTRDEATDLVDEELERLMRWPHRGLQLVAERFEEVASSGYEAERQAIADKRRQVRELVREQLALEEDLSQKLASDLDPLRDRRDAILALAEEKIERLEDLELPTYEAEEPEGAAEGWLFDSRRGYIEQQRHYNARKFGTPIEHEYDEYEGEGEEPDDLEWWE